METIGFRIRDARKKKRLTQNDLAKRAGCYGPDISDWENNKITPTNSSLIKLCSVLGYSPDWFLTGQTPKKVNTDEIPLVQESSMDYQEMVDELSESNDAEAKKLVRDYDDILRRIRKKHKGLKPALRRLPKKAGG